MKELMETWRKLIREAKEEEERRTLLGVEVEADADEFEEGDELEIDVVDDIDEWKSEDDYDYPSRKKRRKNSKINKPGRSSWVDGYDELKSLSKGRVGLDTVALQEAKKKRKPQCHAYQSNHGMDGKFVKAEDEKGS